MWHFSTMAISFHQDTNTKKVWDIYIYIHKAYYFIKKKKCKNLFHNTWLKRLKTTKGLLSLSPKWCQNVGGLTSTEFSPKIPSLSEASSGVKPSARRYLSRVREKKKKKTSKKCRYICNPVFSCCDFLFFYGSSRFTRLCCTVDSRHCSTPFNYVIPSW